MTMRGADPTTAVVPDVSVDARSHVWTAVAVTWSALIAGAIIFASARVAVLVAIAPAAGMLAIAALPAALNRRAFGLMLTWAGLLAPFIVVEARNVSNVQASLLTPLNVFQGIAPMMFLVVAQLVYRKRILPLRGPERALLGFGGACVLSTIWSIDAVATALRSVQLLVVYLLLILLVRQLGSPKAIVRHLVGAVYVSIAAALVGVVVDPSFALAPASTYDYTRRITVFTAPRLQAVLPYIHPDLLGLLSAVALLSLIAGVGPRWSRSRHVQIVTLAAASVVLVLTQTRSALFLLLIGLLVLAAVDARSRSRVLVMAMIAVVVILLVPALQSQLSDHLRRGQDSTSLGTLTGRTTTWHFALVQWAQRPLTGFGYYAGHRFSSFSASRDLSNLDNMYVETLVDVGLVGLGTLVLFLLTGLQGLLRSARSRTRSLAMAILSASVVGAAVNPSLQTPGVALIVGGVLLLVPWAPASHRRLRRHAPSTHRRRTRTQVGAGRASPSAVLAPAGKH